MASINGSTDNLSAVLHQVDDLRLEQTPLPQKPGPNEVILQTCCVGICGSDVHYWKNGRIGDFILTNPIIMGHETCAVVVEVGDGVKNVQVGDRVAVEPAVPCRICSYCKEGAYNLCVDMKCHATPPYNGSLTRFFKHPADFCFKLPDNLSNEEGSLMEPLSVGVHANRRGGVSYGSIVLVCGAGPIGLVNIMVAKAFGAQQVCVTDINEERLKLAREIGADKTVLVGSDSTGEQLAKEVIQQLGQRPNISIECSGAQLSIKLALLATKDGGKVVLVGCSPPEVTLPMVSAATREVDIMGSFRYKNCFPTAISLVASGKVNVKPLVSHRFAFEQTVEAFELAHSGKGVKVMIHLDKN